MPAEANRFERRLGRRDRRFLAALACAALIGTTVAAVAAGHGPDAPPQAGCVTLDQPGVMGGGTWHFCGANAVAFCRQHAAEDDRLAAQCRRTVPVSVR